MKNNFYKIVTIFLSLSCLLLVIRAIHLMQNKNELIENSYSNDYVVNKKENLTMMLETDYDSNQYELATSNEWPTDGYTFNSELSACKNGSQVAWDSETNRVMVYASSIDSCYIYFDKEPDVIYLADYIKNEVYTGVDGENDLYYHDGIGTYTNALQEAGDYSYRYSGANPNNYVCFASDTEVCPNDNLYRIIGVFGENVKLIKHEYATIEQVGTNGSYVGTYAGVSNPASYYKGTTSTSLIGVYHWHNNQVNNTWNQSQLNTVSLNTNYINYLNGINNKWLDMIVSVNWVVGGNTYQNILDVSVKSTYTNEIISPAINTTYNAKIGLIYGSDYGYAASPVNWTTKLLDYNNDENRNNNWMYMGLYDWIITRRSDVLNYQFCIDYTGDLDSGLISAGIYCMRPVFYLNSNVAYVSGDGSSSNPYRLELN